MMSEVRDTTFTGCNVADIEVGHHDIRYIQTPDLFFFPGGLCPPGPPVEGPLRGPHATPYIHPRLHNISGSVAGVCGVCEGTALEVVSCPSQFNGQMRLRQLSKLRGFSQQICDLGNHATQQPMSFTNFTSGGVIMFLAVITHTQTHRTKNWTVEHFSGVFGYPQTQGGLETE